MNTLIMCGQEKNSLIYKVGAWSAILMFVYSFITILVVSLVGGPPDSAEECFRIIAENRYTAYLRLDILTVFVMPLYYILFLAIYAGIQNHHWANTISYLLVFAGVSIFLSAPSVFSFTHLYDQYVIADSEFEELGLMSACEGLLSTDIWHGTGPRLGGILIQLGATIFSIFMLGHSSFRQITAIIGIVTHGLDLLHVLAGFINTPAASVLMAIAGVLYLLWFPLISIDLFRLSKSEALK
jgi:hypothetical protein